MLSLLFGVAVVSAAFAILQAKAEVHALKEEIERQAVVLVESQQRAVTQLIESDSRTGLQSLADQFHDRSRLAGMAVYDAGGQTLAITPALAARLTATPEAVARALRTRQAQGVFLTLGDAPVHVLALPLADGERLLGAISVVHEAAFIGSPVWRHALTSAAQTLVIVMVTLLIIRWSLGKPLQRMAQWLGELRTGNSPAGTKPPSDDVLGPLTSEVTHLATSLTAARAAAEEEARLRDASLSVWTAERLRISMQAKLNGSRLFAVSNREPYEHRRQGGSLTWSVPASGLVTALEPVLRASDGTWIAQGTGAADREAADDEGRLRVPPDQPQYTLRRVWLSKAEEQGFYYGFANEGIWPLCHIAHTRPAFRTDDWAHYQGVNRKFNTVVVDEMDGEKAPLVLVQDYHFALLPRMIKERRPDARVAIFWHIPWPNPEAFGICPWQHELLDGMLGADLIGFHIQAHCNNFLQTVDRTLESRIDWEHFAVNRNRHLTMVRPFPISVASNGESTESPSEDRESAAAGAGFQAGVSRCRGGQDRLHQGDTGASARHRTAARPVSRVPGAVHVCADRRAQPHAHPALSGFGGRG